MFTLRNSRGKEKKIIYCFAIVFSNILLFTPSPSMFWLCLIHRPVSSFRFSNLSTLIHHWIVIYLLKIFFLFSACWRKYYKHWQLVLPPARLWAESRPAEPLPGASRATDQLAAQGGLAPRMGWPMAALGGSSHFRIAILGKNQQPQFPAGSCSSHRL